MSWATVKTFIAGAVLPASDMNTYVSGNTQALFDRDLVTLLKANSGTDTNAAATNVDTIAISGLTAKDTIIVHYTMESVTQATANPRFYNNTDSVLVAQVNARSALSAGGKLIGHVQIMQAQSAVTRVFGLASDINFGVADTTPLGSAHDVTFSTNWTGSWTLALRHGGVTAGGTFKWSWSVYKVAGQ